MPPKRSVLLLAAICALFSGTGWAQPETKTVPEIVQSSQVETSGEGAKQPPEGSSGSGTQSAGGAGFRPTPAAGAGFGASGTGFASPAVIRSARDMKEPAKVRGQWVDPGEAGQEEQEDIQKLAPGTNPRSLIAKYVEKLTRDSQVQGPPGLRTGTLSYLCTNDLSEAFPTKLFYTLRYRQYPVGIAVPRPLSSNNIFCIEKGEKPLLISSEGELEQFFKSNIHSADATSEVPIVASWLILMRELVQDGMFKFQAPGVKIVDTEGDGTCEVEPVGGNSGGISVKIKFTAGGDIDSIVTSKNIRTGMRPICQSTKLLDPDPIVRKMAEQDLLIMGRAAKEYLDEQRAKASPELQHAIDEIWRRIQSENRY